jgi:methionyl-tRNA synthetase
MSKTFYITTAIYYTNSSPHVGHAYEMVLADVIARYRRLKGEKVFFLTGVDQHGQKVQQSAAKAGLPPAEFVKGVTQKFLDLSKKLNVQYNDWAETTNDRHKKIVRGILQSLFDEGEIYKDKQSGYYSVRQEQFLTDKERSPDGQFGPEWGEIEFREEENYYFKLSRHKDWLLSYIDNRKDAVMPDFRQTELRNAVERISDHRQSGSDLCISRPKSRLDWGIELPFDKDYVTYVWFDALTNYISFAGYDPNLSTFDSQPTTFLEKWPALHVIGKDILVPAHGIYWLIMLHALGFPDDQMPQLLVHGWWNLSGAKMSKSAGNVVDPFALVDKYGPEALRYYLMSDIVTGQDADFSEERLVVRYDTDLANSLGNLLNRTLTMVGRYQADRIAFPKVEWLQSPDEDSIERYKESILTQIKAYESHMSAASTFPVPFILPFTLGPFVANGAIGNVMGIADQGNRLVESAAPWELAKGSDNASKIKLNSVLYSLTETLRIIAILISPVLPKAAHGIFDQLNWKTELSGKEERFCLADADWGKLPDGHVVGKPVPLFPRIES